MKTKKRVFHKGDVVYCMTFRHVIGVGYENTIQREIEQLMKEAGLEGERYVWQKSDIFHNHPMFKDEAAKLRAAFDSVRDAIDRAECKSDNSLTKIHYLDNDWYSKAVTRIVGTVAHERLLSKVKEGNERKLFFGEFKTAGAAFPRMTVSDKRTVATGVYMPSSSWGEDDFEPACLTDRKSHVILTARPHESLIAKPDRYDWLIDVLADDCVFEHELKVMDKMREDPAAKAAV